MSRTLPSSPEPVATATKQMSSVDLAKFIAGATISRKRTVYTKVSGFSGWLVLWIKLVATAYLEQVGKRFMDTGEI